MPRTHRLDDQLAEIPFLDHHCQPPLRLPQAIDKQLLRAPFTGLADPSAPTAEVAQTLTYHAMIPALADLLDCEPTEDAVLQARAAYSPERYHRLLADDARLGPLYADYLFAESGGYSLAEWATLTSRTVRPVLQIETFAERLLGSASSWEAFRLVFSQSLAASRTRGVVAFKSIAACRTGLGIERVDGGTAEAAFDEARYAIATHTFDQLTSKSLVDAIIWETLEVASELGVPIQFHAGFDRDGMISAANPALLQTVLQEPRYREVPIVLLQCYPNLREAACLSASYPNVYVDLGLTVPLATANCAALIHEVIALAPVTKLLASSSGRIVPEFQWLAARVWRQSLARVLADLIDQSLLDDVEAVGVAELILHANSERLYPA